MIVDTNVLLATVLGEPEAQALREVTADQVLVSAAVLPFEISNALSAMVKRKRLQPAEALAAWELASKIPVELVAIDVRSALSLALRAEIYAYDAYVLEAALRTGHALLTLDRGMKRLARELGIELVELQ